MIAVNLTQLTVIINGGGITVSKERWKSLDYFLPLGEICII